MANLGEQVRQTIIRLGPGHPIRWVGSPDGRRLAFLEGRVVDLEAELGESERRNADTEAAFQNKNVAEEQIEQLKSNGEVLRAQLKVAKDALGEERRSSKRKIAQAEDLARAKHQELEGRMKAINDEWEGRMRWQTAGAERMEARERWLWSELRAARNWIRSLETFGPPGPAQASAPRPPDGERRRGKEPSTSVRVQTLERQLLRNSDLLKKLREQVKSQGVRLAALRKDRDDVALDNQMLAGRLKAAEEQTRGAEEEVAKLTSFREKHREDRQKARDMIFELIASEDRWKNKAAAAEARLERSQETDARKKKERATASSRVDGKDITEAYFLGFDDCRTLAELVHPGVGLQLQYPIEDSPQREHQVGEGASRAGTAEEPIDLNNDPAE